MSKHTLCVTLELYIFLLFDTHASCPYFIDYKISHKAFFQIAILDIFMLIVIRCIGYIFEDNIKTCITGLNCRAGYATVSHCIYLFS